MPEADERAEGPLEGVRVLDMARVIAGPYAARLLADLGADVVKLEPPAGDPSRDIAPRHDRGMSANFVFANAGKRGLAVDLHRGEGRELVLELAGACDVVIENFRPKVLGALGLGWETLRARNPRVVLVSMNGYGRDSSLADDRAYAPIMHAATGVLDEQANYAGQPSAQFSNSHADTITSLHATVALLAALRVAERTGEGQHIEVPMYDSVLTSHTQVGRELLDPPDDRVMNPIYDAGPHGRIATAGPVQHVWRLLSAANADLDDPTPTGAPLEEKARLRHQRIERWLCARPNREAVLRALAEAGIACAPVVSMHEALTGPVARERGLLVRVPDGRGGERSLVRPAARFSTSSHRVRGPAPQLGEHNTLLLGELLGYAPEEVEALEAAGVLARGDPGD
jgi:crotonobetainyl-CoA:carnitine CoA-transferase CaiB-like acyl-CoA transferase